MLDRKLIRSRIDRAIFLGGDVRITRMRIWALLCITSTLLVFWKMLTEISALYPSAFWLAVFGPDPLHDLGPNGAILLALYIPGAAAWWIVSACLLELGKLWTKRIVAW